MFKDLLFPANSALSSNTYAGGVNTSALLSDREWSERQAQKQMDFQREMSDTSWQRAVADMEKAGLNPALAYTQGGASSASGASASTSSTAQRAELQEQRLLFGLVNSAIAGLSKAAGAPVKNFFQVS